MGLFAALQNASSSLDAYEQAMGVVQNNVSNASTPGYVTQTQSLQANPFQPGQGLWGGVQAGDVESARNQGAEQSVWNQNQLLGSATQQASSLNALQAAFDVSGKSGIPAALSNLYAAFSAWSATPSDATAQQQVMLAAQQVTQSFNQTSTSISQIESQTNQQAQSTVSQINQLASQIAQINDQRRNGAQHDAGLDAQLYNDLEQLSKLTDINAQPQPDGTVTVLVGAQIPLVIGTTLNQLQVTYLGPIGPNANAPPDLHITTSTGQDATNTISEGQLAGLIQFRNVTLPSVIGNGQQQGSINQLAQAVADRVNTLLTNGQISSGPPPVPGIPLFTYQAGSATAVAQSLSINPAITGPQLAAIDPGPPAVANGTADKLAQLANPQSALDMVNGQSYTDFYSSVATDVGSQASSASSAQDTQTQLVTQAQNMRAQISGVSLNEQASKLLQFQQAYEASSRMISVINQTMQDFFTAMQSA